MVDFADLHARFDRFESQLGVLFRAVKLIAKGHPAMTKLTDEFDALIDEVSADIDTVSGYTGDGDTKLVSSKSKLEGVRDKLKQVIADHEKAHAIEAPDSKKASDGSDLVLPAGAVVTPVAPAAPAATNTPVTAPVIPAAAAVDPSVAVPGGRMILADGSTA